MNGQANGIECPTAFARRGGGAKSNFMHYIYSQVCEKIVVNFRAIEKARKGIILHWKSSNMHWKTKQGVKISFYISPYALLVAVQTRKWEPDSIRLDGDQRLYHPVYLFHHRKSYALVFILLTYDEIKRDENYSGNGPGLATMTWFWLST